jgi:hypothetical protein
MAPITLAFHTRVCNVSLVTTRFMASTMAKYVEQEHASLLKRFK